jgi:predicted RNase H-like HicB family nuclease
MPSETNNYSIDMIWSVEDGAYLAQVRELPGCLADGATAEEAFKNIRVVMDEWLETAKDEKREIPPPLTLEALTEGRQLAQQQLKAQVEQSIRETVFQLLKKMQQESAPANVSGWLEGRFSRFSALEKQKA